MSLVTGWNVRSPHSATSAISTYCHSLHDQTLARLLSALPDWPQVIYRDKQTPNSSRLHPKMTLTPLRMPPGKIQSRPKMHHSRDHLRTPCPRASSGGWNANLANSWQALLASSHRTDQPPLSLPAASSPLSLSPWTHHSSASHKLKEVSPHHVLPCCDSYY